MPTNLFVSTAGPAASPKPNPRKPLPEAGSHAAEQAKSGTPHPQSIHNRPQTQNPPLRQADRITPTNDCRLHRIGFVSQVPAQAAPPRNQADRSSFFQSSATKSDNRHDPGREPQGGPESVFSLALYRRLSAIHAQKRTKPKTATGAAPLIIPTKNNHLSGIGFVSYALCTHCRRSASGNRRDLAGGLSARELFS